MDITYDYVSVRPYMCVTLHGSTITCDLTN